MVQTLDFLTEVFFDFFYFQANADIVPEIKSQSALYKPNYWQYRRINHQQSRSRYISVPFGQAVTPSYI